MFGNKAKDLEQQIAELQQQLSAALAAHEADRASFAAEREAFEAERLTHAAERQELQELKDRIKLEELTYSELQSALRQRVQEVDEKAKRYEREMDVVRQNLDVEVDRKRAELEVELRERRKQQEAEVQGKIQSFGENYSAYLQQVQQAVQHLNETALQLSKSFLQQDGDITAQFQDQLTGAAGDSDPDSF